MTTQVQQASARTGRLAALKQDATDNVRIEKHARPFDDFIRGLLMLAGIVSILTTIGIVLVLGNETLLFILKPCCSFSSARRKACPLLILWNS